MRFLLDTHILLWWLTDAPELSTEIREKILASEHWIFVSAASVWEISIKRSLGKLDCPDDLLEMIEDNGFQILSITAEHGLRVADLPHHHKDPFDRMLITQALSEDLTVISQDKKFQLYDVPLLSA